MEDRDLEKIISIMTHIHIIIGRSAQEKNYAYSSIKELYEKITSSIGSSQESNSSYYGTELLDSFDSSIKWMKKRGIVVFTHNKKSKSSLIQIDKEKLIKYIVDPDLSYVDSSKNK